MTAKVPLQPTLHKKILKADLGQPEAGNLLTETELAYVDKYLKEHPNFTGQLPKRSTKNPQSILAYTVYVTEQDGKKQSFAMYKKERHLGEGGFGRVKLAQDIHSKEWVAAKSIRSSSDALLAQAEIIREKNVLKAVNELHAALSRTLNIQGVEKKDHLFINLGYGLPLAEVLFNTQGATDEEKEEKMPQYDIFDHTQTKAQRTQNLLNQVDMALEIVRECIEFRDSGYISRDIKGDNILWDAATKKAKIIDHGMAISFADAQALCSILAKKKANELVSSEEQEKLEALGYIKGTPMYMAPEVWLEKGPSTQTDDYAIGVTLVTVMGLSDGEGYYDLKAALKNIYATKRDQTLKELYPEIFHDKSYQTESMQLPGIERMLNVTRTLTADNPADRSTAHQAYQELIALKKYLLSELKHSQALIVFANYQQLNENLNGLKKAIHQAHNLEEKSALKEQVFIINNLVTQANLLAASYPPSLMQLQHFTELLIEANLGKIASKQFIHSKYNKNLTILNKMCIELEISPIEANKENILLQENAKSEEELSTYIRSRRPT